MEIDNYWTQLTGKILRAAFDAVLSGQKTADGFGKWQSSLELSFEVKKLKKVAGAVSDTYHWIEIQTEHGAKGWLFNPVSFFAFQTWSKWLLVDAAALRQWMEMQTIQTFAAPAEPYKLFNRTGDDLIILVPITDLEKVSFLTIKRQGENNGK